MYTVSWNQQVERLAALNEVEDLLDRLHEEFKDGDPVLVSIELADTGDSLSMGLGSFGGEWSEYPMRNAVPTSVARTAMRQFCQTGRLPESVEWEEV